MNILNKLMVFEDSWSDDKKRKSYLLNFINLFLIIFFLIIILIRFFGEIFFKYSSQENFFVLTAIISLFVFMIFLVKKGFVRIIAFSIIALLLFSSIKGSLTWGIDLYTVDIVYPFIILMSAILIGSNFSFYVLLFICIALSLIYFLQSNGYISRDSSWRSTLPSFLNLLTVLVIYTLMTFLSWLSSREIEKSISNVKKMAKKLRFQNENLEKLVEERTKELKVLQLNQLINVAPLIDLGKLSAGLIHDVREPLSVLSFILQEAKQNKNVINNLNQALLAIDKIDDLSKASACKLFSKTEMEVFNLNQEIKKVISLFEYKSRLKKIKIIFQTNREFELHSDRSKLNQVVANLILNAIESYDDVKDREKFIFIKLIKKPRNLLIKIKDYGIGISNESLSYIFEPNFSSKSNKESLGFGLYVSKEAMKKNYESDIKVESKLGFGSTFTLFIKNKFILNESVKKSNS